MASKFQTGQTEKGGKGIPKRDPGQGGDREAERRDREGSRLDPAKEAEQKARRRRERESEERERYGRVGGGDDEHRQERSEEP